MNSFYGIYFFHGVSILPLLRIDFQKELDKFQSFFRNMILRRMLATQITDLRLAKKELRRAMKSKVAAISLEDKIKQSEQVTEKLVKSPSYINAQSIALYLHMNDEIQTEKILQNALESGKTCFIPRYFMGTESLMEMVQIYDMKDYQNLPLTKWNIKQPPDTEKRPEALEKGSLDVMLLPGMAFSVKGQRLGRGKGYYDKYLTKAVNSGMKPVTIALAFDEQILPDIPCDDHDFILDAILSPSIQTY